VSELFALSFDVTASPSIRVRGDETPSQVSDLPYAWGLAWYPGDELAASVVKDPTSFSESAMSRVLHDWDRFHSTVFVGHLRGVAPRVSQRDAQPFVRSYAGRQWLFAHSGDLHGNLALELSLGGEPAFEPVGRTDSEHAFCWLLALLHQHGARRLADLGWEQLHTALQRVNALGNGHFVVSDGQDLAVYHDARRSEALFWTRRLPPHEGLCFAGAEFAVELDGAHDHERSFVLFSTKPLRGADWWPLEPGELRVANRGAVVWASHARSVEELRAGPVTVAVPSASSPPAGWPRGIEHTTPEQAREAGAMPSVSEVLPGSDAPRCFDVYHETVYRYVAPVERSTHKFRLRPLQDDLQRVLSHDLDLRVDGVRREFEDVFGNYTIRLDVDTPFGELVICARSRVEVRSHGLLHLRSPERRDQIPLVWMPWQRQMMLPYLLPPELPETELLELSDFAMSFVERNDYDLVETLLDMNRTIYRDFTYVTGSTTVETTPFQVFSSREGVCQDFANLLICMARLLSVPARYRVGYIYTGADYENKIQSEASHAWVELYLPWTGWRGFDPTNGCTVRSDHVRVATGRHFWDAAPTSGTIYKGGGGETLSVEVRVDPVS
jgi:transglutaminase-like putative cysteine protease/predicted glutamine amidotransferase